MPHTTIKQPFLSAVITIPFAFFSITATGIENYQKNLHQTGLEEIIVTAQKSEQSLQSIPIAISVLTDTQLYRQGVSSLGDLLGGTIPSVGVIPAGNSPSTLILSIRGNGPGDVAAPTREPTVAVYMDEIYLGHTQGLDFELAELKRIEVLRGPQGTLYGRNATGGAINLISKRPSGEFGIRQTFGAGNYNLQTSSTHIDLPKLGDIASKIDYLYTARDGWVENTAPGESDYNEFEKKGLRFSVDASINENINLGYSYNDSDTEASQLYYQFHRDLIGLYGDEGPRQKKTRFPIAPLDPTKTDQQLHTVTLNWSLSETLELTSLTAYRELNDKTRNNYGGAAYFNGIIESQDLEQEQFSQEIRLQGNQHRLEWVAGIYYYDEKSTESLQQLFSLDIFGFLLENAGNFLTPITPPTTTELFSGLPVPQKKISTDFESVAIYGQATWTPPVLNDKLELTFGVRHTEEDKLGSVSSEGSKSPFTVKADDETDPSMTLNYRWSDTLSTYVKWSIAHRSGGINFRSTSLTDYKSEQVETAEIGLKTRGWDNRLYLNLTAFQTRYDNMFIDVYHDTDVTLGETLNAADIVTVDGAEMDLTITPIEGLRVNVSYTYLNGYIPPQANPLNGNAIEQFFITQTPQHAGSLTLDYEFPRFLVGTLSGHLNVTSSSDYSHWASGGAGHPDGYLLVNARIDLAEISLAKGNGDLTMSLWGKNITDEEYVVSSLGLGPAGSIHAFGDPRTAGVEIKYEY